jgi:hypothetical protein
MGRKISFCGMDGVTQNEAKNIVFCYLVLFVLVLLVGVAGQPQN